MKKLIKNKIPNIIITLTTIIIISNILLVFKINTNLIFIIIMILIIELITSLSIELLPKYKFYKELENTLKTLDKKYLIKELIYYPEFLEGKILYDTLYEINKNMIELHNKTKETVTDFKEYIEIWLHEIKIPLSTANLLIHTNTVDKSKLSIELKEIENKLEQILYYTRSETSEKDYLIKEYNLKDIINEVIKNNKEALIQNKIKINLKDLDTKIYSDSKWLAFIINQILNNSIKYIKENPNITITTTKTDNKTTLVIEDNGIGIKNTDLKYIFEKSFTGTNGRTTKNSTGMGLYITKKMCKKLGMEIKAESKYLEYTKILITFNTFEYYQVR